jgi:XTP/dITP diphosphohydrolase
MLLAEMAGKADRNCRFVCCMTLAVTLDRVFVVQETCEGQLLDRPRGAGGFGYDPIVFLPELGRSVAELSPMEKNRVSHRGRAIARMAAVIESIERLP